MTFADTIAGRLERHADRAPTRAAFTFLSDGELNEGRVDRAALRLRATAIATHLQQRGLRGERVLLLYESGLEFVAALLACFYSGATAVPATPPRRGRWIQRLEAIARDARPTCALFDESSTPSDVHFRELLAAQGIELIATDTLSSSDGAQWRAPHTAIDDGAPALLQYTSGSTSTPRGVVITHANLIDNLERIRRAFGQSDEEVIVSWLPMHHDMGLIGTVLEPIYTGAQCVLMSPARFTEKPSRWLRAIDRYRATTSGGPDFAYALCAARVTEEERAPLDLSTWRLAFNGAEPVRATTLRAFARRFAPNGFASHAFLPCYGLAEATLFVCGSQRAEGIDPVVETFSRKDLADRGVATPAPADDDRRELVACGPVDDGVVIVDPDTRTRCADGSVGEIWLRSPSVGGGYWNRPADSMEAFQATLRGSRRKCLRTGDLGFVQARQLYVTGRRKDVIIVRGRNHDPQDIELSVERDIDETGAGIGAVAAIAWDAGKRAIAGDPQVDAERTDGHTEGLALVIELRNASHERGSDAGGSADRFAALAQRIREVVARDHEIAPHVIVFVPRGGLARTTSGKLQRGACRQALESGALHIVGEWRAGAEPDGGRNALHPTVDRTVNIDGRLMRLVRDVLGSTPPPSDPLIRHGLDSMKAASLSHRLAEIGVDVMIVELLAGATLVDLQSKPHAAPAGTDSTLAARLRSSISSFPPDDAPLTSGQQALWFLQQVLPSNTAYHVAVAARVVGQVSMTQLDTALLALCDRHPMLRARFSAIRGTPRQSLVADSSLPLTREALTDESELPEAIAADTRRPFALADASPARATLFEIPGQPPVLLLTAHHIVADLWSLAIVIADLAGLLSVSSMDAIAAAVGDKPEPDGGYFSHARMERASSSGGVSDRSRARSNWEAYWATVFHDVVGPILPAPAESDAITRSGANDKQSWRGLRARAHIDSEVTARIEAMARAQDTTAFVVVCSAFQSWIRAQFDRDEFFIGTPTHGRTAGTASIVGHFVNMLPLRCRVERDVAFDALVAQTRRQMLDALAHEVPFQLIVDRFAPARTSFDTPWLQAVFVWQASPRPELPALGAFASGAPGETLRLGDVTLESVAIEPQDVPFDLTLTMARVSEGLVATLDCRAARFDRDRVDGLAASFAETLARLTGHTQRAVLPTPAMTGRSVAPTPPALLHHRFEAQAHRNPEATAVCDEVTTLSYGDLDARANQLARHLRHLGATREELIGIHLPRSVDLAVAILGVLKAGGAYLPIDEQAPAARVKQFLSDSGARLLITNRELSARVGLSGDGVVGTPRHVLMDAHRVALDSFPRDPLPLAATHPDQLAYCIYTSGSTGEPKGVLITHANVLRLFDATDRHFHFTADDVWTLFHSPAFDFSVWEFWGALLYGGQLVMVPYVVSRDPHVFAQLLARHGVTVLNQTPSAFRQLMPEALAPDVASALRLRLVIFGGEALSPAVLRPWTNRFGTDGPRLVNMYGITETTVHVTYHEVTREEIEASESRSAIGRPIDDLQVHLVDEALRHPPEGEIGEICVGGAGLARGYLGQPALTAERFVPDPFSAVPDARMYRSGDLARVDADSAGFVYAGRADRQMKVRGVRIEPGEIEAAIRRAASIRDVIVIHRTEPSRQQSSPRITDTEAPRAPTPVIRRARQYIKRDASNRIEPLAMPHRDHGHEPATHGVMDFAGGLIAYVVPEPSAPVDTAALHATLRATLPDAFVPTRIVTLDRFPLNANGKLDLEALPSPSRERPDAIASWRPPEDEAEAALADVWAQVLGVDRVGVDDNYFALGGDSIRALQVVAFAAERGVQFDVAALFRHQTIRALRHAVRTTAAPAIQTNRAEPFALLSAADRSGLPSTAVDAYPLSRMQAGLIFHSSGLPGTSVYRATFLYEFIGAFDAHSLRMALRAVVDAHPILRTSFDLARFSEPLQIVHDVVVEPLEVSDLRWLTASDRETQIERWLDAERVRDFDLEQAPLFRAHAHRLDDDRFALGLTCHDAILDGWSTARLLTEWLCAYHAARRGDNSALRQPSVAYADFVAAERHALLSVESAAFWQEALQDCTVLHVPGAYAERMGPPDLRVLDVPIDRGIRDGLLMLARRAGVSLKHVLLAAHMRVLSVTSGVTDVLTGLESNGRVETEGGEEVLGQHLNTIPFRQMLRGTWIDLVLETVAREQALLPFRRFPYAEIQRRTGGRPLYDTTFNYTHFHVFQQLARLDDVQPVAGRGRELTHYVLKTEFNRDAFTDDLALDVIFDRHAIDEDSVLRIGQRYTAVLRAMAETPDAQYDLAPLLSAEERREIATHASGPVVDRGNDFVPDLFETVARRTPDRVAVRIRDAALTYRELDARANHLARRLRHMDVSAESRVAIFMERSLDLVVAILAVLKAGAAYVPLDPDYPAERLRLMAEDARVQVVLTEARLRDRTPVPISVPHVCIDEDEGAWATAEGTTANESSIDAPPRRLHPQLAAYIIYTSGSTGRPKGAINSHAGLVNRLLWMQEAFEFDEHERILQKTPCSFDVSVWEFLSPLIAGGELVLAEPGAHRDPDYLADLIASTGITTLHFVPSMLASFLDLADTSRCKSLRRVICSGEALTHDLRDRCLTRLGVPLHNLYGPTEAAVDVTAWDCTQPTGRVVPIGRPIANTTIHLLDAHLQPAPPGTSGELCIGGIAVGRGYWQDPRLTAERFVPDPFSLDAGARLYRTGDLARLRPDGSIEYLGRQDAQVKVHGVRIELGEIESALRAHSLVRDAAVLAIDRRAPGSSGSAGRAGSSLAACVVLRTAAAASGDELREWLFARLPRAAVPGTFTFVDALPLTPSGKLDRRALAALVRHSHGDQRFAETTRPADEETLTRLLQQVEGLSDTDVAAWLARASAATVAPTAATEEELPR
jgi:amino acid adenylation domain-containing protein